MNNTIKATDATFITCGACNKRSQGEPICNSCKHNALLILALREALSEVKAKLNGKTNGLGTDTALHQMIEDVFNKGIGMVYINIDLLKEDYND
ncbi:MAG: hypothetical protein GY861_11335 [bacterium]|nr:hypothetical protein [bacterium]